MTRAVDLFAGWGGFTLAAESCGVRVAWAANHWPLAVDAHRFNHPATEHVCQDLRQADWTALPRYELLLASPACQGHSSASQPKRRHYHDAMRATAWAVVDCAEVTRPRAIVVENVPAFMHWQLYPNWQEALRVLGYHVDAKVLLASHCGVPQRRERLFVVATRKAFTLRLPRVVREPDFGQCVQWDEGDWRPVTHASPGAQERIARAQRAHGPRCLVQHVTGHPGVPLDEPIRTITTKDQWAIVDGRRYRPLTERENARGMGFPDHYGWPSTATRRQVITGLGNAVPPPMARVVIQQVLEAA